MSVLESGAHRGYMMIGLVARHLKQRAAGQERIQI